MLARHVPRITLQALLGLALLVSPPLAISHGAILPTFRWKFIPPQPKGDVVTLAPFQLDETTTHVVAVVQAKEGNKKPWYVVLLDGDTGQDLWTSEPFDHKDVLAILQTDDVSGDGVGDLLVYFEAKLPSGAKKDDASGLLVALNGSTGGMVFSPFIPLKIEKTPTRTHVLQCAVDPNPQDQVPASRITVFLTPEGGVIAYTLVE